jgi:hypothetical protein
MAVSGNTKPWGIPGINPLNADSDRFYFPGVSALTPGLSGN